LELFMPVSVAAAVLRSLEEQFTLETLSLDEPGEDEVLVKVTATGICHTDIKVSRGYANVPLPVVLGHEGAGIIERTGKGVTGFAAGDHVVLTFPSCGQCAPCISSHPAYCDQGQVLSFQCSSMPLHGNGGAVHGGFFGQSSFATHALCRVDNVVKVDSSLPLEKLGPLGCGFQTGAGAVLNVMQPVPGQSLAVFGSGNVGLSAVMAARIAGMNPVIALDVSPDRLAMAASLGATHVLDLTTNQDPVASIHALVKGGVNYALDTINHPPLVRQAFESLANRGTCIHSGGGGKDLCFPGSHLLHGRTITGVIQGDSDPKSFIPQLIDYYREGRFPFDRLLTFYELAQINQAVEDMEAGKVIKPVLRMPESLA